MEKKFILHIQNSVFKYIGGCTQSYCIYTTLCQHQESVKLKHNHHFLICCKNKKCANRSGEGSSFLLDNHILLTTRTAFTGNGPQEDRREQPSSAVCGAFAMNAGRMASSSALQEFRSLEPSQSKSSVQVREFSAQSVQEDELRNRQRKENFLALKYVCRVHAE